MSTFEDFLRGCLEGGHTQVRLVPRYTTDGSMAFYAHGQCGSESGETFDGSVGGNQIGGPEEQEVAELAPVETPEMAEEPMSEPVAEEPMSEPVAEEPVAEEPVEEPAPEEPVTE